MVEYKCLRCGYDAKQKINLIRHLKRKNPCKPTLSNISIENVQKYYNFEVINCSEKLLKNDPKLTQNDPKLTHFGQKLLNKIDPTLTPNFEKFLKTDPKLTHVQTNLENEEKTKHMCSYCKKCYSKNSHMRRHEKTCKHKTAFENNIKIKKLEEENKKVLEQYNKLQETIEKLILEKPEVNTITNNNTNINNTNSHNTINIHINNFGEENKRYITKDYISALLEKPFQAIPELIKYTHFNEEHPENHNLKITNKKDSYMKVLKNNKWELVDKKTTISDLIDKQHSQLNSYDMDETKLNQTVFNRIETFNKKYIEDDKDFINKLYKDSELIILNNSQN